MSNPCWGARQAAGILVKLKAKNKDGGGGL